MLISFESPQSRADLEQKILAGFAPPPMPRAVALLIDAESRDADPSRVVA